MNRYSRILESLRWLLIALPLASTVPHLAGWEWPLAGVVLLTSLPMLWLPTHPDWLLGTSLVLLGISGSLLWLSHPTGLMPVIVFTTLFYAVRFGSLRTAIPVIVVVVGAFVAGWFRFDVSLRSGLLDMALVAVVVLLGLNRRSRTARLEQTQLALARAQTAAEEHARAATLAERARIARELHDVLAHSLSGLALNLQGARLMLRRDGASAEAVAQVERAQQLAVEGLSEARKAVAALREDPVPLERAIRDLLDGYRLDTSAEAELIVHGEPRAVEATTTATVLRAVQEALSNTRKHAPGSSVQVTLVFEDDEVTVTVLDHQGRKPAAAPLTGYGLRGMRERAELLGGQLSTGPEEDGWRVHLAIPA
ncbi:sensor histidine kinase [Amycolatopsis acidicola]|uniref:histidine kinase n=1 Tax=Amycolatopsis acidicola TaxID=2596893 RepID=A0A5N0UKG6_9PSEU|nr:sensor histidine kinase [Amycolatopsis acidicola]KAA9149996.1 sensor histidine kinase [Amycolatopsis acidicola]